MHQFVGPQKKRRPSPTIPTKTSTKTDIKKIIKNGQKKRKEENRGIIDHSTLEKGWGINRKLKNRPRTKIHQAREHQLFTGLDARNELRPLTEKKSKLNIRTKITLIKIDILIIYHQHIGTYKQEDTSMYLRQAIYVPRYVRYTTIFRDRGIALVTERLKNGARNKISLTHPNRRQRRHIYYDPRFTIKGQ